MPNYSTRVQLFLSSYAPLYLILMLKGGFENGWVAGVCMSVLVLSVGWLLVFLWWVRRIEPSDVVIGSATPRNDESMSYVFTYVIPFLEVPLGEWKGLVSFAIFFLIVGIIYINSNMIHVNPVLNLLGFSLFEVETEGGTTRTLIAKRWHVSRGTRMRVAAVGTNLWMELR